MYVGFARSSPMHARGERIRGERTRLPKIYGTKMVAVMEDGTEFRLEIEGNELKVMKYSPSGSTISIEPHVSNVVIVR